MYSRVVAQTNSEALAELRRKHGFVEINENTKPSTSNWSKSLLAEYSGKMNGIPAQAQTRPKNAPLYQMLETKLSMFDFGWKYEERVEENGTTRHWVKFKNYPTLNGRTLTLADLVLIEPHLLDGYDRACAAQTITAEAGQPISAATQNAINTMTATGVGYKGLSGTTWLPGTTPFELPTYLQQRLVRLGQALIVFFDVVRDLYAQGDEELRGLLTAKAPDRIPQLMLGGRVDVVRPDIVIASDSEGKMIPVVTEFESCPAGQGMAYAMESGYGLEPTMINAYLDYLRGRDYIVLATNEWSDYVFEQGCFVKALRAHGVNARLVFDRPLEEIHSAVQTSWTPPKGIPSDLRKQWNSDFLGRLESTGFAEFTSGYMPDQLAEVLDPGPNTVVYRFGYFDNFPEQTLNLMAEWQGRGATVINPLQFFLESKVLMAAVHVKSVRNLIAQQHEWALEVLDTCVAETRLLDRRFTNFTELYEHQPYWLTKYAAWDGNNQSWGSRSLLLGTDFSQGEQGSHKWEMELESLTYRKFPIVAQHIIASKRFDASFARNGKVELIKDARTRLTPFFLRKGDNDVMLAGSTITLRENTFRIHGATDAYEAPVVYIDKEVRNVG